MDTVLVFLRFAVTVLFVMLVHCGMGTAVIYALDGGRRIGGRRAVFVAPAVGLSVLGLAMTFAAQYGVAVSRRNTWAVVAGLSVAGVVFRLLRNRRRTDRPRQPVIDLPAAAKWWTGASLVGVVPWLALMPTAVFRRDQGGVTWLNNDLGAYLLMSTNLRLAGGADSGIVRGTDMGDRASWDHPAANGIFSAVAAIRGREPFEIGSVLMAAVLAVALLAAAAVVDRLADNRLGAVQSLAVAAVVINTAVVAAAMYFYLAQILAVALLLAALALALELVDAESRVVPAVLFTVVALTLALVSVESAAWGVPWCLIVAGATPALRESWKPAARALGWGMLLAGVVIIWQQGLFRHQLDFLVRSTAGGSAGWKASYLSPAMLMGWTGHGRTDVALGQYGGPALSVVDVALLVLLGAWLIRRLWTRRVTLRLGAGLLMVASMVVLALAKWGTDGYQTWKLITSLLPLAVCLLLATAWRPAEAPRPRARARARGVLVSVIALSTVVATLAWTSRAWGGPTTKSLDPDLVALLTQEGSGQGELNIILDPYFETMAAAAVHRRGAQLVPPTYFGDKGSSPIPGCTLTTQDRASDLGVGGGIVAQRGKYVLVGMPACG